MTFFLISAIDGAGTTAGSQENAGEYMSADGCSAARSRRPYRRHGSRHYRPQFAPLHRVEAERRVEGGEAALVSARAALQSHLIAELCARLIGLLARVIGIVALRTP